MIDQPPGIEMIVGREMTVTLPVISDKSRPCAVLAMKDQRVTIMDADGRQLAVLDVPGMEADFEIDRPAWWQIWKSGPRWKRTR